MIGGRHQDHEFIPFFLHLRPWHVQKSTQATIRRVGAGAFFPLLFKETLPLVRRQERWPVPTGLLLQPPSLVEPFSCEEIAANRNVVTDRKLVLPGLT